MLLEASQALIDRCNGQGPAGGGGGKSGKTIPRIFAEAHKTLAGAIALEMRGVPASQDEPADDHTVSFKDMMLGLNQPSKTKFGKILSKNMSVYVQVLRECMDKLKDIGYEPNFQDKIVVPELMTNDIVLALLEAVRGVDLLWSKLKRAIHKESDKREDMDETYVRKLFDTVLQRAVGYVGKKGEEDIDFITTLEGARGGQEDESRYGALRIEAPGLVEFGIIETMKQHGQIDQDSIGLVLRMIVRLTFSPELIPMRSADFSSLTMELSGMVTAEELEAAGTINTLAGDIETELSTVLTEPAAEKGAAEEGTFPKHIQILLELKKRIENLLAEQRAAVGIKSNSLEGVECGGGGASPSYSKIASIFKKIYSHNEIIKYLEAHLALITAIIVYKSFELDDDDASGGEESDVLKAGKSFVITTMMSEIWRKIGGMSMIVSLANRGIGATSSMLSWATHYAGPSAVKLGVFLLSWRIFIWYYSRSMAQVASAVTQPQLILKNIQVSVQSLFSGGGGASYVPTHDGQPDLSDAIINKLTGSIRSFGDEEKAELKAIINHHLREDTTGGASVVPVNRVGQPTINGAFFFAANELVAYQSMKDAVESVEVDPMRKEIICSLLTEKNIGPLLMLRQPREYDSRLAQSTVKIMKQSESAADFARQRRIGLIKDSLTAGKALAENGDVAVAGTPASDTDDVDAMEILPLGQEE